jgi:hypothetical protein
MAREINGDASVPRLIEPRESGSGEVNSLLPTRLNASIKTMNAVNALDACHDIYESKATYTESENFRRKRMSLIPSNLSSGDGQSAQEKGELKMKVSLAMLLKTHIEKMSLFRLATMFMETNDLSCSCHDVDEK